MHRWLPLFLIFFAFAATAPSKAGPIRYERIPASVTGYLHIDFDGLSHSRIWKAAVKPTDTARLARGFGEHWDVLIYTLEADGADSMVVVLRLPDPAVRRRIEQQLADGGAMTWPAETRPGDPKIESDLLQILYRGHAVTFAKMGLNRLLGNALDPDGPAPATPPHRSAPVHEAASRQVLVGFGNMGDTDLINKGPIYVAFIDPDLVVIAPGVPEIAMALDVIDGRKPALATSDPKGLKCPQLPGAMIQAAGVIATYSSGSPSTQPSFATAPAAGHIQLGPFPSVQAKLATFILGEDEQYLYCDTSFGMTDTEAAQKLKGLVTGASAILSLAQPDTSPLIAPLSAQVLGKQVRVHWYWSGDKSAELVSLVRHLQADAQAQPPSNASASPTTRPANHP